MFVKQCSIHRSRANYVWGKKKKRTTSSCLQACFVVTFVGSSRWLFKLHLHLSISTALMRPRRPKQ